MKKLNLFYLVAFIAITITSCSIDNGCEECKPTISKVDTLYINTSQKDTLLITERDTLVIVERDTIVIPTVKCTLVDTNNDFSLIMYPKSKSPMFLSSQNLSFNILDNGNVEIIGNVENIYVNIVLLDPGVQVGDPIMNDNFEGEDPTQWQYWGAITGTITDLETNLTFTVSLKGSSPQYGINANNQEAVEGKLGFGAWIKVNSNNCYKSGDLNFNIECN